MSLQNCMTFLFQHKRWCNSFFMWLRFQSTFIMWKNLHISVFSKRENIICGVLVQNRVDKKQQYFLFWVIWLCFKTSRHRYLKSRPALHFISCCSHNSHITSMLTWQSYLYIFNLPCHVEFIFLVNMLSKVSQVQPKHLVNVSPCRVAR